jgi:hypothetical protein
MVVSAELQVVVAAVLVVVVAAVLVVVVAVAALVPALLRALEQPLLRVEQRVPESEPQSELELAQQAQRKPARAPTPRAPRSQCPLVAAWVPMRALLRSPLALSTAHLPNATRDQSLD